MSAGFKDSKGKKIVREKIDTVILKHFNKTWNSKYLYLGLPGRDAVDIKLWQDLIHRVIAFEIEDQAKANPKEDILELTSQLVKLCVKKFSVYNGYLEEVILKGRDEDGKEFNQDELITLYNLDFCNAITGKINSKEGFKCLRFEAIRNLLSFQTKLSQNSLNKKFVLFLTILDQIGTKELERFLRVSDLAEVMKRYVATCTRKQPFKDTDLQKHTSLTKAFVFSSLRDYLKGHGISSYFYPMTRYIGASNTSQMLHFPIVCSFQSTESATTTEIQGIEDFLKSKSYQIKDENLFVSPINQFETVNIGILNHPTV